jgi:CelD/BcsL family acetyltransferase involved in cellulose biosynthesis
MMTTEIESIGTQADGRTISVDRQNRALQVKKLTSWKELEVLFPVWDKILQDSEGPTIFSTAEWLGAWWRSFGQAKELVALAFVNSDDEVVGLIPLYSDWVEGRLRPRPRRLRFVGDGSEDSDNLDLILRRGYEDSCAQAFLSWLAAEPGWDICELNTLPTDSASARCLLTHLKHRRWAFRRLQRPCMAIFLPQTWEDYLDQISKKEKTKINYYTGRLKKRFDVSFSKCTDEHELPACLETLFELHQKHWELRGGPGTFSSSVRRALYYDIGASFLSRGWLELWMLNLDGKSVAAQFGFRYRDTVYSLQEGFDPSYSTDRVGYLLRAHVLRNLIGQDVRRYDFLGGEARSKERWGAQLGNYVDIHFARPFTRGSVYLGIDEIALSTKSWLRLNLSPVAFKGLRRVYRGIRG